MDPKKILEHRQPAGPGTKKMYLSACKELNIEFEEYFKERRPAKLSLWNVMGIYRGRRLIEWLTDWLIDWLTDWLTPSFFLREEKI